MALRAAGSVRYDRGEPGVEGLGRSSVATVIRGTAF